MSSEAPTESGHGEQEPLLGRTGDASQVDGKPLVHNLVLGTAIVGQFGIWIQAAIVWSAVFSNDLILFSAHPLLNTAGLVLLTQGALILQPTHTPSQKKRGTYVHGFLNNLGVDCLIAGLVIIEVNKYKNGIPHFESAHSILGFITYVLMFLQAIVGFLQYFTPTVFGGEAKAKAVYKYHRISGYLVFTLALATVCAATQTSYNRSVLFIPLWTVIVASVITLMGVVPRIKKEKLGISS
ncbi:hypothetical protein P152DRAFT_461915 [Eremomyces bilateralis CBS 781.70]|uniref:Cytochrome b561 domain-containing protein n=1 Tax=Eremomyces bilateralis CBS 781.70 TaxID=1392243 RepID=A0A6G1FT56_9PEZI|nr:uncharacterized protein P152DRAFT_461915 [Eremomyces bilateralis CBS 781.70]KAF1809055.1 hypothetical protein P152DRAFT_461915 [Eremomyces bilateralis CBS 781.70]